MAQKNKIDSFRKKLSQSLQINKTIKKNTLSVNIDQQKNLEIEHIYYVKENNYYEQFIEKEILGQGCAGTVYKVIRKQDNQQFACKIVKAKDEEQVNNIIYEFKNCRKLDHINIVKVFDLYIDYERGKIFIIMELIEAKEMFVVIQSMGGYSEEKASKIFKQILSAINYLHEQMICHRDLKPSNILVNQNGNCVKITDFNISKFGQMKRTKFQEKITMWTHTGTIAYCAPEIFNSLEYNQLIDMWSAGILLYVMLSGKLPFNSQYEQELIQQIQFQELNFQEEIWDSISYQAKDLIKMCLHKDPNHRISPDQALLHPWITQRQNTSPLSLLNFSLLTNNYEKLLLKLQAYNDLGLINIQKRKNQSISYSPQVNNDQNKIYIENLSEHSIEHSLIQTQDDILFNDDISQETNKSSPYKCKSEKLISLAIINQKNQNMQQFQYIKKEIQQRKFNSNIIFDRFKFNEDLQSFIAKLNNKNQHKKCEQIKSCQNLSNQYQKKYNKKQKVNHKKNISIENLINNNSDIDNIIQND